MRNKTEECSNCGAAARVETGDYRLEKAGLKNVVLTGIQLIRCPKCGNVDPVIPAMNKVMQVIAGAVAAKPYRLKGEEIRFLRKYLGMSGEQFARLLGADKTTLSKWENDADVPGDKTDRLIRAVALSLGEGLRALIEETVRAFPEIKDSPKEIKYRISAGERTCQYA